MSIDLVHSPKHEDLGKMNFGCKRESIIKSPTKILKPNVEVQI